MATAESAPAPAPAEKKEASAKAPAFPRGTALPDQSPLFWVHQKDRYLRQLLIRDLELVTGRDLIVYFTDCTTPAQIDFNDDTYLVELLGARKRQGVDLLLETNGGFTDATEKVVTVLRGLAKDLRVIVPRRAKSNGTLVALCGSEIVMGVNSELGPIDPNVNLGPQQSVPATFLVQAANAIDPIVLQVAQAAMGQTKKLAKTVLAEGMLKGTPDAQIQSLVDKISSRTQYHSHGSVIDHSEAKALGLKVAYLAPDDTLWRQLWLLRSMYEHDCRRDGIAKVFEGAYISSSIALPQQPKP